MPWRSWLNEEDAHGVTVFEVVAKSGGSTLYAPVVPAVSFEGAYRWASSTEKYAMGKSDTLEVLRVFADPPRSVGVKQGLRSAATGVANAQVFNVTSAVEERGEGLVLIVAERTR